MIHLTVMHSSVPLANNPNHLLWPGLLCFLVGSCSNDINTSYGITDRYIDVEKNTPGIDSCYNASKCDEKYKYRTPDGTCNNLQHTFWGSAQTAYMRLLPAHYNDGVQDIRKSENGAELPNVRLISSTLYPDVNVPDKLNSLALMQWGQVVTHDSASSGFPEIFDCCPNGKFPDSPKPECYPITIPAKDPFYSRYNVTCMGYTRLDTTTSVQNCPLKPQQQISYVTQWLDLSLLYGSDDLTVQTTRELRGGLLKSEKVNGGVTLPISHEPQSFCRITSQNQSCLNTGDIRVNQNPHLGMMTVVLLKEHNALADKLSKLNTNWNDEQLYQEARRINIAQAQHITYSEYLQHIVDKRYVEGLKVESLNSGYTQYNASIYGGTLSEFTGSVFRTFHSTVQGDLKLIGGGSGGCPFKSAKLGDYWWTSGDIIIKCFEQLSKGLLAQPARIFSNYFTNQETNFYQRANKSFGDDLEAIDLMRARDQGISSYNQYRKLCGLTTFSSIEQLQSVMNKEAVSKLKKLYTSVEDIDLYVGAVFEIPVKPGLTGPTAQCIMAQQFARWKYGDRFYYEHENQAGSFTKDQLAAIKRVTFSSLICRNTKVGKIQKKGFFKASVANGEVDCKQIPSINLNPWKE